MKYGFIGCGNMGSALARALSKTTLDIMISDIVEEKAHMLASELGCRYGSNSQVAGECERLFLAVKPQKIAEVLDDIHVSLAIRKPVIISVAAGINIEDIEKWVGNPVPIIRIMPNTPVSTGDGMILYCKNNLVSDGVLIDFLSDIKFAGTLDRVEEEQIDAACSVQGCGPAFMYMFIEAMADGAVACGVPRDKAVKYAAATMLGSAQAVLKSGKHPGQLKDEVCSPAGSTIMGVKALEDGGFRAAVMNAVIESYKKNKDLGK